MPKLVISGIAHDLVEDLVMIGRGPDNTIIINDPSVSTRHAQLQLAGETYQLKDLDSTNGTRVNGIQVMETTLRSTIAFDLARPKPVTNRTRAVRNHCLSSRRLELNRRD